MKRSAGILIYKKENNNLKVFLTHPGGPYWENTHLHSWGIPKGELDKNERYKAVAGAIDKEILYNYKLWNNNYIAYDILNNSSSYIEYYTPKEKEAFMAYMDGGLMKIVAAENGIDLDELREIFLGIYANPVAAISK